MTQRRNVKARRIYDPALPEDGTRVLVDRIWPRGVSKARAQLDEWCKDIAPSTELRKWYSHDPALFEEFARRYRDELSESTRAAALAHLHDLAKKHTLTLLTATKNADLSEAAVLADLVGSGKAAPSAETPTPPPVQRPVTYIEDPADGARRLNDYAPVRHSLRVWLLLPSRRVPPRAAATRSALVAAGSGWDRRR